MKLLPMLVLASLVLVGRAASQEAATKPAAKSVTAKSAATNKNSTFTESDIDRITDWKNRMNKPDVVAVYRTKFGDEVTWESWGPKVPELNAAHNGLRRAPVRYANFPRVYRCTIRNHNWNPHQEAEIDLYDVGVQRHDKVAKITFASEGPFKLEERGNKSKPAIVYQSEYNMGDSVNIRAGRYNVDFAYSHNPIDYTDSTADPDNKGPGDYVKDGMTLKFSKATAVLVVYRAGGAGGGMPGEAEGSPPPADPGNNHNEAN